MKRAFLLLALLCAPIIAIAGEPENSAAKIEFTEPDNSYSAGSGTVIASEGDKSLVLTCAHVVMNGEGKLVTKLGNKDYDAKYLSGSKVTIKVIDEAKQEVEMEIDGPDLALLILDVKLPPVDLATSNAKKGDKLRSWGYMNGGDVFFKTGKVVDPDVLSMTLDARPGDSGSGLFNDANKLVGVTHSRPAKPHVYFGFATPVSEVREFLTNKVGDKFPLFKKSLSTVPQFIPFAK